MNPNPIELEVFNNTAHPRTVTVLLTPYDEDDSVVDERTVRVPRMPEPLQNGSVNGSVPRDQLPNHRVIRLESGENESLTCRVDVPLEDGTESRSASVSITVDQEPDEATTVVSIEAEDNGLEADETDGENVDIDRGNHGGAEPGRGRSKGDGNPGRNRSKRSTRTEANDGRSDDEVVLVLERLVYCDTAA
ncbi:hypothetical protein [Natronorubrum daqingense]|uniref:Uncharacterized protein n=1 Tax=Natronorubrum daqingense TaxID=588898 RepID=A0A1N7CIM7_9EURY|nr:hypothetical protein [Natronorubrum daqingense]APX96926.1 hypothetical protein BB347_09990 [Natronorubrum daqingense]SIR63456.1 hypothetical protein SAMN05421809_1726 [Natronorubrum daqingense]